MQYSLVPLDKKHFDLLDPQPFQAHDLKYIKSLDLDAIMPYIRGHCLFADDKVIACSGILRIWPGRWQGWSIYGNMIDMRDYVNIRSFTRDFLDLQFNDPLVRRIEITVLLEFTNGHAYAQSLGFIPEGVMRSYDIFGRDHVLYARVR